MKGGEKIMNKFKTKLGAAVAMAAVIATTLAPAAMADTINVTGNGENSTNNVTLASTNVTTVNQSNDTLIVNGVLSVSNTGANEASGNTGGNTGITTGNSTTKVIVENTGSSNDATLNDCGCQPTNTTVNVKRNGENSKNTVVVANTDVTTVTQVNKTRTINLVGTISNTGLNKAKSNTGGNTGITTGNTKTKVRIINTGSSNTLH